nr:cold shock protein 2-like [Lolium perenne]
MATAIQDAAKTNAATTRQLARLDERLDAQAQALERFHDRPPSLEEDDPDPDVTAIAGTGTLKTARVAWQGETAGASASQGALGRGTTRESARGSGTNNTATGGAGFLGGGGIGGAGGGGVGGASGGGVGGAGGGGYGGARGGKTSHDIENAKELRLSLNAIAGKDDSETIRL